MSKGRQAKEKGEGAPATQTPDRKKKMRRQVFILLAVLITLGAIAQIVFFMSSDTFRTKFLGFDESLGLKSMTDGKLACDKKVKGRFGRLLQYSTLNNTASRYDDDFGGYKLFYDVSIYRNKERNSGVKQVMYKCHIHNDGDIREARVIQSTRDPNSGSQEIDGNIFGF
jgi:hypothetical protein